MLDSQKRLDSHKSATAFVITAIEAKGAATRNDFDVPAIVATSHAIAGGWEIDLLEKSLFWTIVAANLKT